MRQNESEHKLLKIGELAKRAGVGVDTIRYYEREGLLPAPLRQRAIHHAGYRLYDADEVKRLQFILRAKNLGFTLKEIGGLLALRTDQITSRSEMREQAKLHLADVESRIRDLQQIRKALGHLVSECEHGDPSSACPILEFLEEGSFQHPRDIDK